MAELRRTNSPLTTAEFAGKDTAETERMKEEEEIARQDFSLTESDPQFESPEQLEPPERPRLVSSDAMRNRISYTREDRNPDLSSSPGDDTTLQNSGTESVLFSNHEVGDLQSRWNNIQAGFVDEPRRSVEQADHLVATAMQRLAEGFASERAALEQQWESGDNVSTEDLRVALQRYRTFFGRLLNAA